MALRKPLFMTDEGFSQEMATSDTAAFGGLTLTGNIAMGGNKVTGLGAGSADQDAVTKAQLDAAVISGGSVKEALFSYHQLSDTLGFVALEALFFAAQPAVGDTVVLKDGTLTRTYTFVEDIASESAATDVSHESSAATAMQRLVTRANADAGNTQWTLYWYATEHGHINADGVVGVQEKVIAAGASTSRIYGTWTTQADFKVVKYGTGGVPYLDYTSAASSTALTSDPGSGEFGVRRQQASLTDGEIHAALDTDEQWIWDLDGGHWQLLSSGALPDATSGSGGGTKGKVTADEDYGLLITSGVLKIDVEPDYGLQFVGGDLAVKPNGSAAIGVGSGGVGVLLAGTNPGLEFRTGGDAGKLGAKAGGANGIVIGATGIEIEIDDSPDTLDVDADGLKVVGLPSLFKINDSSVSANVTATNLNTLTAGTSSYADALHQHARVEDAQRVAAIRTAGEAILKGDPVYVYAANQIGKGDASNDAKSRVIGVAAAAIAGSGTGVIVSEGIVTGVGSSWTANDPVYLAAGGGLTTTRPAAGSRIVVVGYAWNGTDLFVDIRDFGKRAA